ncbi:MAG: hypothetical protein AAGF11_09465 [Myxococcota bacterium]
MSSTLHRIVQLAHNDARLVARDNMLILFCVFLVAMGIGMRYALPALDTALAQRGVMPSDDVALRFSDTYPAFVVFVGVWQGANIPGVLVGFLLLGEKEDRTLAALRVTPLPFSLYTGYRVGFAAVVTFASIVYLVLVMDQCPLPWWPLLPIAVGGSLTAPLAALFYATFAADKVQGLAFTKFAGVAGLSILLGYFAPEPWQWLLSVFPPFLIAKAYWMALEGRALYWMPLVMGSLLQLGLLVALVPRFRRVAAR